MVIAKSYREELEDAAVWGVQQGAHPYIHKIGVEVVSLSLIDTYLPLLPHLLLDSLLS